MATGKLLSTRSANVLGTEFDSLASTNYAVSPVIDLSSINPVDVAIELAITPGATSGEEGVYVFAKVSMDGTNYTTGPESGAYASTNDEPDLVYVGFLSLKTDSTLQRGIFNIRQASGFIPKYFKIVIRNSTGAALGTSHTLNYITWVTDVA